MMHTWYKLNVLLGSAFLILACGGGSGDSVGTGGGGGGGSTPPPADSWSASDCSGLTGSDYLALTTDGGQSFIDSGTGGVPVSSVFAFGLVRTGFDTLVAVVGTDILRSVDAGCTWSRVTTLESSAVLRLTAAGDGSVYVHSHENAVLYHISFDEVGNFIVTLTQAPDRIVGLGVDAANPMRIRLAAGTTNTLFHSDNGGSTFTQIGVAPRLGAVNYFTSFEPTNLDHIMHGTDRLDVGDPAAGVWVSFDGGSSWQQSSGFGSARINGFGATISEANPNLVWLLALDVDKDGFDRRSIYRSTDGGLSFDAVIGSAPDLVLNNSTRLYADPSNVSRLVFAITDPPNVGVRQTHLYVYDYDTDTLGIGNYPYEQQGEIQAMAFNPDHADNMFFTKTFQILSKQDVVEDF